MATATSILQNSVWRRAKNYRPNLLIALSAVVLLAVIMSWFWVSPQQSGIPDHPQQNTAIRRFLSSGGTQHSAGSGYKYYFDVWEPRTMIGLVFLGGLMCLCTMAGVGGNVVIYPVCLIFFQFDAHVSIGHASLLSGLSSLVRILVELTATPSRKTINYDVILFACTPTLMGSLIGLFLNQFSPDLVIMVLTLGLLGYLMVSTYSAYLKRAQEEWDREQRHSLHLDEGLIRRPRLRPTKSGRLVEMLELDSPVNSKTLLLPTTMEVLSEEVKVHDQYSFESGDIPLFILFAALNPLFSFLRGNKERQSILGIDKCGASGYALVLAYLGVLVILSRFVSKRVIKRNLGMHEDGVSIEFADGNSLKVMSVMFLVGLIASFLSAGAATLLAFSLIMLHMTTFTASPTSLMIMLILGLTSAVVFYAEGLIFGSAAIYAGIVTMVSSLIARLTLYESFVKKGKASLVLLFNSLLMAISLVGTAGIIGPAVYKEYRSGKDVLAFKSSC